MEHFHENTPYTVNKDAQGRVKILDLSSKKLLLDQPNMITYRGADIVALAVAGQATISSIYVGYSSTSGAGSSPALGDTITNLTGSGNYAKIPITFSPSFAAGSGSYTNNLVYFTVYVTGAGTSPTGIPSNYYINQLGLVGQVSGVDTLFSHISFTGIQYTSTYGIAITWGLTFTAA